MIVIVMGVSGSGKTTVGKLLAERLGWRFEDADDYHSAENKAKMRSGQPLNDQDREPWLDCLRAMIEDRLEKNQGTVLACSALKNSYREKLVPYRVAEARASTVLSNNSTSTNKLTEATSSDKLRPGSVVFLCLKASFDEIASRLAHRKHEFMNPELLKSQFQTLEEPTDTQLSSNQSKPEEPASKQLETIVIDTDCLSQEEVADEALRRLKTQH